MWLTAQEALARLGSKPQSLYASVSRGRIRAKADPADSRKSLYRAEDVDRLASRSRGRRSSASVAAGAISWGDPMLPSALSTVSGGRLFYRGQDAALLSRTATLEQVGDLLCGTPLVAKPQGGPELSRPGFAAAMVTTARLAAVAPPSSGHGLTSLGGDAAVIFATVVDALLGPGAGHAHTRLAAHFGRPASADVLRRALVLLADHELNASTFAARVAVSTGAPLAAGVLAGLATLNGPMHGAAANAVRALADDLGGDAPTVEAALRDWLGEGRVVPGFGHPLYAFGDPRAAELLSCLDVPARYRSLISAAEAVVGDYPNVDLALAAMTSAFDLPPSAPLTIFALGRTIGWLAHTMEQAAGRGVIRPRARYVGPPIQS